MFTLGPKNWAAEAAKRNRLSWLGLVKGANKVESPKRILSTDLSDRRGHKEDI